MARWISVVTVVVVLLWALPAAAACDRVIDSRAYDDGGDSSFCWLSGMICYYCWGSLPDEHCASDWEPCDTAPPKKGPTPIVVSAPPVPAAPTCAAKTLQPEPGQVKLEHIL
jgi:hypothetical protein